MVNAHVYKTFGTPTGLQKASGAAPVGESQRVEITHWSDGKIVVVSSVAYNYSTIDENDIDFSTRKKASKVYGNSKRFLTFALMELLQNSHCKLSIVHPGITLTQMTNHYPKYINWLVKFGIKILFPTTASSVNVDV